jgi:acyl dehydratase
MIGATGSHTATVSAETIAAFCALTGDDDPLHVDAAFAAASPYGSLIAPGSLVIAYMMAAAVRATGDAGVAVPSVGFDRIRHTAAVRAGDTLVADYRVVSLTEGRGHADVVVTNQAGETVAVADHVFKVLA